MILITGAAGFLGMQVADALQRAGYSLRLAGLRAETLRDRFPQAETVVCDITRKETLEGIARDCSTVIHLAGLVSYTAPEKQLALINTAGTRHLLEQCTQTEKFIFSSSVAVYGEIQGQADETYPVACSSPYGRSKRAAELAIKASGVPYTIFRFAPVYGAGSPQWLRNLRLLDRGFPLPNTPNLTHVLHSSDCVRAIVLGVEKGEGVYNIADREPVPFLDFGRMICKQLGREPRLMPVWQVQLLASLKRMGRYLNVLIMNRHYKVGKAGQELGFVAQADLESQIAAMVEWYQASKKQAASTSTT